MSALATGRLDNRLKAQSPPGYANWNEHAPGFGQLDEEMASQLSSAAGSPGYPPAAPLS